MSEQENVKQSTAADGDDVAAEDDMEQGTDDVAQEDIGEQGTDDVAQEDMKEEQSTAAKAGFKNKAWAKTKGKVYDTAFGVEERLAAEDVFDRLSALSAGEWVDRGSRRAGGSCHGAVRQMVPGPQARITSAVGERRRRGRSSGRCRGSNRRLWPGSEQLDRCEWAADGQHGY